LQRLTWISDGIGEMGMMDPWSEFKEMDEMGIERD
jgi:hypothetical protein